MPVFNVQFLMGALQGGLIPSIQEMFGSSMSYKLSTWFEMLSRLPACFFLRRNNARLFCLVSCVAVSAVAGCARISEMSGADERAANLRNLTRLEVGMTKTDVVRVMGEPLKDEKYHKPDVWYYYTDWDWADGVKTSSECTPVVFEEGKLVGWGHRYYKQYRQKDWR